jgi:hypothetical protein
MQQFRFEEMMEREILGFHELGMKSVEIENFRSEGGLEKMGSVSVGPISES